MQQCSVEIKDSVSRETDRYLWCYIYTVHTICVTLICFTTCSYMLTFVQRTKFGNVWGFEPVMLCMFTMKDTSTVQCTMYGWWEEAMFEWNILAASENNSLTLYPGSIKHLSKYNSADRNPILHLHKKTKNIKYGANHSL